MNSKNEKLSISAPSDRSKTLWSDFLVFRNSSSDVAVNRASGDFPPHKHEFAELSFPLSGFASHREGSFSREAGEGDFALVVPGSSHSYERSSANFRRLNVQIRRGLFEELSAKLKKSGLHASVLEDGGWARFAKAAPEGPLLSPAAFSNCLRLAFEMEREWLAGEPGFAASLEFMLGSLLLLLLRSLSSETPPLDESRRRLLSAVALVDEGYAKALSLEDLERAAGMERRTLERAFKRETGLSPKAYLMKTRLSWACRLLQKRELRMDEIAAACGFEDANYFSRAFKKAFGSPPGAFASNLRPRS